jgi:hypothetical protein
LFLQREHVCGHRHNLDPRPFGKAAPDKAHALRSVVGHYIVGTTGADELLTVLADLG